MTTDVLTGVPTFLAADDCRWLAAHGGTEPDHCGTFWAPDNSIACSCEAIAGTVAALTPLQALDELVRLGYIDDYRLRHQQCRAWKRMSDLSIHETEPQDTPADLVHAIIAAQGA